LSEDKRKCDFHASILLVAAAAVMTIGLGGESSWFAC
jgi:hypothetical protein